MNYRSLLINNKTFWEGHPALFVGLHLAVGAAVVLFFSVSYLFLLFCLWAPLVADQRGRHKIYTALLLLLCTAAYTTFRYPAVSLPEKRCSGRGHFSIHSLKVGASPFQRSLVYCGTLQTFVTLDGKTFSHLPCKIFMPVDGEHPTANRDYLIEGVLIDKGNRSFFLKASKWKEIAKTFSLAEWRFRAKQKVHAFLHSHFSDAQVANLLTVLITGDLDDRMLSFEFGRVGLQHLLAISGFHFAILAAFCSFFLRLLFSIRWTSIFLLLLLTIFYLFLGDSPSIQRAWCAISLFLIAQLLGRQTSALNALGCALILEILIDPNCIRSLGFHLSFLATLALLLLYQPIKHALQWLLPERCLNCLLSLSRLDQHAYLFCHFLRQALAANFAVHLTLLPVLLYLFHKFSLLSFLYNLFFPVAIAISLLLLLTALPLHLCPPLAHCLHQCNSAITAALLKLIVYPPLSIDYCIRCNFLSLDVVILFSSLLFTAAIAFTAKEKKLRVCCENF